MGLYDGYRTHIRDCKFNTEAQTPLADVFDFASHTLKLSMRWPSEHKYEYKDCGYKVFKTYSKWFTFNTGRLRFVLEKDFRGKVKHGGFLEIISSTNRPVSCSWHMAIYENTRRWDDSSHSHTFSDDCGYGTWYEKSIKSDGVTIKITSRDIRKLVTG